jgi:catechol 2,3-dioxygenase-like lactoylglutathione lyase family enzyme
MSGLGGIAPITFLHVAERGAASVFYSDVLGLTLVSEDDFALVYDLGGTMLRVSIVQGFVPHPHTVLGWRVTDIGARVDELAARGVKFIIYDGFGKDARGMWVAPDGSAKVAWFNDPFGNNLSLTETA